MFSGIAFLLFESRIQLYRAASDDTLESAELSAGVEVSELFEPSVGSCGVDDSGVLGVLSGGVLEASEPLGVFEEPSVCESPEEDGFCSPEDSGLLSEEFKLSEFDGVSVVEVTVLSEPFAEEEALLDDDSLLAALLE